VPLLDPHFATRRRLKAGLVVAGAVAGFVFGVILTRFAKTVTGAPPAPMGEYLWNGSCFALLAAVVSPLISWSFLRRVPLWRTVVEPLVWASGAAAMALILAVPALVLLLPPVGLTLGFLNLRRRYPDTIRQRLHDPGQATLPSGTRDRTAEVGQNREP
jgi:hypothetical protein